MSSADALLIEIGCEEIPARMIASAAAELGSRVTGILDDAGLGHGPTTAWGGPRRLAVRVEAVEARQADSEETILGPPASVGLDDQGRPTPAAAGFARKQGVEASELRPIDTDRGLYLGLHRELEGKSVGQVLAAALASAVEGMPFPKLMRWGDGRYRWVRPVHWVVALYGGQTLPVTLFDVSAGNVSQGHRFLSDGKVEIASPDAYREALERGHVIVDPAERRRRLEKALAERAGTAGGAPVEDPGLLDEVADLVEWPGVVLGSFDVAFLELPRELLVTTLRHHQKCFSVRGGDGALLPSFLAVANTDRDPGGHVCRGNEWVIGGRLEDARFFWREDRKQTLAERSPSLERVVQHAELGSYADKARRTRDLALRIAERLELSSEQTDACGLAAELAKNDLVTGTVGEFPELQGKIGGLLLRAEGKPEAVARAVYEHYQPVGPDDAIPAGDEGCVVSVADKLDSVACFVGVGLGPTGSRDPFGLRRATNGMFRIVIESGWPTALDDLVQLGQGDEALGAFLRERLQNYLRDAGATTNEVQAVLSVDASWRWPLHDVAARLEAICAVRRREDFAHLVDLTKRVDNILNKNAARFEEIASAADGDGFDESKEAAAQLGRLVAARGPDMASRSEARRYAEVVEMLSGFIDPVDRFFEDVLVIDPADPRATRARWELLKSLRVILTSYFDIRKLAGQADRRS